MWALALAQSKDFIDITRNQKRDSPLVIDHGI